MSELVILGSFRSQTVSANNGPGVAPARRFYSEGEPGQYVTETAQLGELGEQQLVDKIQAAIVEGGRDPLVRRKALQVVQHVAPGDDRAIVRAWFDFLAHDPQVPYRRDPVDLQVIPSALDALTALGIDCKGKTILLGAGLMALGYEVRIVTVDQTPGDGPVDRHHVYLEWLTPSGSWEPIDPVLALQEKNPQPGDELPFRNKAIYSEHES